MDWDEKSLTISLVEIAILENTMELTLPTELLLLSAAFRSDQEDVLKKNLDVLRDRYELLGEWKVENENVIITLTDKVPAKPVSEYEREKLHEKRIRRILLFKLYEVYRNSGNKYTLFPLVSLSELLGIDKDEIFRHVSSLESEYYIEYEVRDGGQCSSDLTDYGIRLCEDRSELFDTYSVVRAEVVNDEEREENNEILDEYVSTQRIEQLRNITHNEFDLTRLIQLCKELNLAHKHRCYLSIAMILRTIINHVPPVFGFKTFPQVVGNYPGGKSFKNLMDRLNGALRKIADSHLHKTLSKKEILPEYTQVNFKAELDVLLSEVISKLH